MKFYLWMGISKMKFRSREVTGIASSCSIATELENGSLGIPVFEDHF
jgi:hypothetical protein